MTNVLKTVRDNFFTWRTFFFILLGGVVWLTVAAMNDQERQEEETKNLTEYCYSQGFVLAWTEVGPRCVATESMLSIPVE